MKKCKFKVGDKVKAINNTKYVITNAHTGWEGIVTEVYGEEFSAETTKCSDKNIIPGKTFRWLEPEFFEKIKTEDKPIVIVEHLIRGDKTIIKLSNGKVGIATRGHDEKFDAAIGAAIATLRAYGKNVEDFAKEFTACEHKEKTKTRKPFIVGQLVQIKVWGEMEREYGLDLDGDILCNPCFTRGMEPLCGMFAEITDIVGNRIWLKFFNFDGDTDWFYSTDMIKPIKEKEK